MDTLASPEENNDKIELTPEQIQIMLDTWNKNPQVPPSFQELSKAIFGVEHDGRDKYGQAIKKALSTRNLKAKSKTIYEPKKVELTEEHKLFITNNAATMKPLDMARVIFTNPDLTNLNIETRAVADFVRGLDTRVVFNNGEDAEDVPSDDYRPPKTVDQALKRVNQYVNYTIERGKLSAKQKKELETLINYLHNSRLTRQINNYDKQVDRNTFEDAFIRYTHNKPDLTQEEVDQYVMLGNEIVSSFKIQRRVEKLQGMLDDMAESQNSAESVKLSMTLNEAIASASKEYDDCLSRQQDLLNDLTGKRSTRISKEIKENSSILNLLQAWREEETRKDFLKMAEIEQRGVEEEVQKLSNMEDVRARILGLTKNEILGG
jgi:hypothetical protein